MKNVIVGKQIFENIIEKINEANDIGFDIETTGLLGRGEIFSMQVAVDEQRVYYFNFYDGPDHLGNKAPDEFILPRKLIKNVIHALNNARTLYIHNALFEAGMCAQEGVPLTAPIHCTLAQDRVLKNDRPRRTLEYIAPFYSKELKVPDIKHYIRNISFLREWVRNGVRVTRKYRLK